MSAVKPGDRVGVLMWDGGTCLAPAIVVSTSGQSVTVMTRKGGKIVTLTTVADYVEPPSLPETAQDWLSAWEGLEWYRDEYAREVL